MPMLETPVERAGWSLLQNMVTQKRVRTLQE